VLQRLLSIAWVLIVLAGAPAVAAQQRASQAAFVAYQLQLEVQSDYTLESDPDQLLGLPGQYTARAMFDGGSVEVFSSPADRDVRWHSLVESGSSEWLYRADFNTASVLLRLSGRRFDDVSANRLGRQLRAAAPLFY
jgi:hypothetical protein